MMKKIKIKLSGSMINLPCLIVGVTPLEDPWCNKSFFKITASLALNQEGTENVCEILLKLPNPLFNLVSLNFRS